MSDDSSIRLQVTIGGIAQRGNGAVMLLGEYDLASGVLLIDTEKTLAAGAKEKRIGDSATLSNNAQSEARDMLFTEEHLADAIRAFFDLDGRKLLILDEGLERLNPHSRLQVKSIEEKGRKYELAQDITDGQVAVLAMCWFAMKQAGVAAHMDALDDTEDDWDIMSVGLTGRGNGIKYGSDGWPR
jgi:hypothetical protein